MDDFTEGLLLGLALAAFFVGVLGFHTASALYGGYQDLGSSICDSYGLDFDHYDRMEKTIHCKKADEPIAQTQLGDLEVVVDG